jgi:RHS repeat-associated protein
MAASGVRYLYKDRLGSITVWTNSAGVVQATFAYGPYGEPKTWGGSRFGYTGQVSLSELGLYHYHNRVYDPATGRFLQTDPIGYGDGPNMYLYAHGDPVNGTDPLGLIDELVVMGRRPIRATQWDPGASISSRGISSISSIASTMSAISAMLDAMARDTSNTTAPKGGTDNSCASPPTSAQEKAAAQRGDRKAYWRSRAARGDPLGETALSIVNDEGMGIIANIKLALPLMDPFTKDGFTVGAQVNAIGVQIMRAHVDYTAASKGHTSARGVRDYHVRVFRSNGLPDTTFGGAMATGSGDEAELYKSLWLKCKKQ